MQYDFNDRELIEDALRELSVRLCVDFVPRGKESSYILYTRNGGYGYVTELNICILPKL